MSTNVYFFESNNSETCSRKYNLVTRATNLANAVRVRDETMEAFKSSDKNALRVREARIMQNEEFLWSLHVHQEWMEDYNGLEFYRTAHYNGAVLTVYAEYKDRSRKDSCCIPFRFWGNEKKPQQWVKRDEMRLSAAELNGYKRFANIKRGMP